jgi:hypothetical protein
MHSLPRVARDILFRRSVRRHTLDASSTRAAARAVTAVRTAQRLEL